MFYQSNSVDKLTELRVCLHAKVHLHGSRKLMLRLLTTGSFTSVSHPSCVFAFWSGSMVAAELETCSNSYSVWFNCYSCTWTLCEETNLSQPARSRDLPWAVPILEDIGQL